MNVFLNFFTVEDWFNRPGPYGFNLERILFVLLCALLSVFVLIQVKNKGMDAKKTLIFFWLFAVGIDLIKFVFYNAYVIVNDLGFDQTELPLWTCSIYLFAMPLSLFSKNEKVKDACNGFICSISMLGGFINFLFSRESLFSFLGLHTFVYHFILLITPIVMLVSGYYKPKFKDYVGAVLIFVIYAIPVFVFDNIFQQDYMFIYDGSWFGPAADFAALMPHKLIWTFVCILGHALVATLMIYIESKFTL